MSLPFGRRDTSSEEDSPPPQPKAPAQGRPKKKAAPGAAKEPEAKRMRRPAAAPARVQSPKPHGAPGVDSKPATARQSALDCAHADRCDASSEESFEPPAAPARGQEPKAKPRPKTKAKAPARSSASVLAAGKRSNSAGSCEAISGSEDAEDAEARAPPTASCATTPKSSSVFDYVAWAVQHILTPKERLAVSSASPIAVGSMCAGMGAEEIALHSIRRELLQFGSVLEVEAVFRAEKDPAKLSFLRRRFPSPSTRYFSDNNDLRASCPKDADGQAAGRPTVNLLLCGIVCKDISGLNNNPKSEREQTGTSGSSLTGLLSYVGACNLMERPKVIILECVERLDHKRSVDPDDRTGTRYINEELALLGYVGHWSRVSPTMFFLPQSRPRVHGLFLKVQTLGPAGLAQRQQCLSAALGLLERLKVPTPPEALSAVLARCQDAPRPMPKAVAKRRGRARPDSSDQLAASKGDARSSAGSELKWQKLHAQWMQQKGMCPEDLLSGREDFRQACHGVLLEREVQALWLQLGWLKKKMGLDWRKGQIVATVGASLNFMSVRRNIFPCATPGMRYIVLDSGTPKDVDGTTLLALQGVQGAEVRQFNLDQEKDALLKNLSGNAFTANILAAFLLAGLAAE